MNINKITDEELEKEIRGRCITNMAAEDLAKFIRQCVDDSQVKPLPSKPEPTVTQKLLKAQELHSGVTSKDKLKEENRRLKEAVEYALHFASGHYDEDAQEDDPSPDDMTAHINGLIVRKCRETLTSGDKT